MSSYRTTLKLQINGKKNDDKSSEKLNHVFVFG